MEDFEQEEGGDEGQIAIDALKEMRSVLRAAMSRMPQEAKESDSIPEEIEDPAMEAADDEMIDPVSDEVVDAPIVEKKTVLASITPKYSGSSEGPPPEMAMLGKLKAKKKGF